MLLLRWLLVYFFSFAYAEEDFKVNAPIFHPLSTEEVLEHSSIRDYVVSQETNDEFVHEIQSPEWIRSLSISLDNVMPNSTSYPRGMSYRTTKKVRQNETLLTVPFASILTMESALSSELGPFFKQHKDIPEAFILALHLLYEKLSGEKSRWFSYIQQMPEMPPNLVILPPYLAEITGGSYLGRLLTSRTNVIIDFFDDYEEILTSEIDGTFYFTLEDFTKESLAWAIGMVWSRSMLLDYVDPETNKVSVRPYLMPVIDTMTICENCTTQFQTDGQKMVLIATKEYEKYEEVQVSSPVMDAYTYLMYYGIYRHSPMNLMKMPFIINVDPSDNLIKEKNSIFKTLNLSMNDSYALAYNQHSVISSDVLVSMRLKVLTKDEIENYREAIEGKLISPRNEYAVCRSLRNTFMTLLDQYKTTMDEDENVIANENTSALEKPIRQILVIEKQILHEAVNDITQHWQSLLENESF